MPRFVLSHIVPLFLVILSGNAAETARVSRPTAAGGVLHNLAVSSFPGSGQNSIQAIATDAAGNIFVAGTTSSPDLDVKNAVQPAFGEARILVSTDLGRTWQRVSAPADTNQIAADPVAPEILFAVRRKGIYKSTDSGRTWRQVSASQAVSLVVDPGNHLRVAALIVPSTSPNSFGTMLVRSLDGGETWAPGGPAGGELQADPGGSGALLLSTFGASLSRDWGLTFQMLTPPGLGTPSVAAFDPSHPGWIYVVTSRGSTGMLFLTTDYGVTWTTKKSPGFFGILHLAVAPDQPSIVVAATPDGLYKSSDGAASWTLESSGGGPFGVEAHDPFVLLRQSCGPTGGLFAVGSGPGYFQVGFSPDFGMSWNTPQLSHVDSVSAGGGCTVYVAREPTTDAFVAKLAPNGSVLWTTYLGGADGDAPIGIAVDRQGNAYVAGNTTSPDFPATLSRIGPVGQSSVFLTKFSSGGQLVYSVLLGGEASNAASVLAIDAAQNVLIGGRTNSRNFPITPNALVSSLDPGSYGGFLVKLSILGTLSSSTYLGPASLGALVVDANNEPVLAGIGPPGFVMALDASLSRTVSSMYLPNSAIGVNALAIDRPGNLLIAGLVYRGQTGPMGGGYAAPAPVSICTAATGFGGMAGDDAFITKLSAVGWKPVYTALLAAPCGVNVTGILLDSTGAPVLAGTTGEGFPLRNPVLAGPTCVTHSSLIARLSPDGSALDFGTYLDGCGPPAISLAQDRSLLASTESLRNGVPATILHLPPARNPAIQLGQLANAFSGDASAIVIGGLYSLALPGLQLPVLDEGLNPSQPLPLQLGGVQVKFDGIPAPILRIDPGRVLMVVPQIVPGRNDPHGFARVQVIANGVSSDMVWMPISNLLPGLLTRGFPDLVAHADFPDGNVRNEDGTLNDADHPAPLGSTITVFATGIGVAPYQPLYSSWQTASPISDPPAPLPVSPVPGFISAVFQIRIGIPASGHVGGTPLPNGVERAPLALRFSVPFSSTVPVASNFIGVYIQ